MRTLEAVPVDPPFKIKDVPVKQNPTPKATDEKGNPKHWVRKRIEKQRSLSGLQPAESESPRKAVNQGPLDSLLTPTESGKRSMPGSGRDDVLSPSRISGLLPDLVDEEWLVQCTGTSNLQEVDRLTLKIDTNQTTIERIGSYLPSLQSLVLSNSRIASIRDLGTSLGHLLRLELSQCGIEGLDGIAALSGLKELFLSHNKITDTTPLAMHDHLQLLDLSYNRLCDVSSVEMLSTCPQLHTLHLYNNPVWTLGSAVYRRLVASSIPQVALLDGKRVTAEERTPMDEGMVAEAVETLKHFDVVRPEQSESPETRSPQQQQLLQQQAEADDADPDSKLTQESGFFAGNPSSFRQLRRRQKKQQEEDDEEAGPQAWTGTILEVLDNPDKDIDITPLIGEPDGQDWRSSEAVRGNPMLASLYESMVDSGSSRGQPSPSRIRKGGSRRPAVTVETTRRRKGEEDADEDEDDERLSARRYPTALGGSGEVLHMPMPVRIERRGQKPPGAFLEQRRLRRRWSREGGEGGGQGSDDSGGESSGNEGPSSRAVLSKSRLASEAQKAGVRLGFNLSESLAAIDQWIEEVDDDDSVVAHRTDLLAKVSQPRRPHSEHSPLQHRQRRSLPSSSSSSSSSLKVRLPQPPSSPSPASKDSPVLVDASATAVSLDDDTLVRMLTRPPKSVSQLRTREAFRTFFRGMPAGRMQRLLLAAYAGREPQEVKEKVRKRLDLLHDVLT